MPRSFHTTMVLTQRRKHARLSTRLYLVSIPLWFSRNEMESRRSVFLIQVSIPLWFSRNWKTLSLLLPRKQVSIPLWFSRNQQNTGSRCFAQKFPYHYGSHATRLVVRPPGRSRMFPYHYGSHATTKLVLRGAFINLFPYHYGSHATRDSLMLARMLLFVSIPLWFSRNEDEIRNAQIEKESFHTTMVLTQLINASVLVSIVARFHTTMVLTQPFSSTNAAGTVIIVSIPLWFSRNQASRRPQVHTHCEFPYHYGSHATYKVIKEVSVLLTVSIPLWFSRNFGWETASCIHMCVSIPLWFSRNQSIANFVRQHIKRFHTTMVLTQLIPGIWPTESPSSFPYHYGSHATE